jgi:hypothetical protein
MEESIKKYVPCLVVLSESGSVGGIDEAAWAMSMYLQWFPVIGRLAADELSTIKDSPEKRLLMDSEDLSKGCLGFGVFFSFLDFIEGSKELETVDEEFRTKEILSRPKNPVLLTSSAIMDESLKVLCVLGGECVSSCARLCANHLEKKNHTYQFTLRSLWAFSLVLIEYFCEIFVVLDSPMMVGFTIVVDKVLFLLIPCGEAFS